MTLENYLAIGLIGLLFAVLVFVVVRLVYDWCDTRKLEAQLKCRQEGYERGYLAGRMDGRAEVQAEWTEAEEKRQAEEAKRKIEEDIRKAEEEKKRQAEEEKKRKAEEEKKRKGKWQGNNYYMYDPVEIVHTYGEFVTLCADQTFSEEELEHIGFDKAKVLLTYKLLAEAAPYVDFCEEFNPMLIGKTLHARLRVVRVNR